MEYNQTWNLHCFFSDKKAFAHFLDLIEEDIRGLEKCLSSKERTKEAIDLTQNLSARIRHASAYVGCLISQNVEDLEALALQNRVDSLDSLFEIQNVALDEDLKAFEDDAFENFIKKNGLEEIAFPLKERRKLAKDKLPFEKEKILTDLSVDGYEGWAQIFNILLGDLSIPYEKEKLSFGQIENKLSHPNRAVRQKAFKALCKPFKEQENVFSNVLNHLAGFRLSLYKQRRWVSLLKEPLENNRMKIGTLNAMWGAVTKYKEKFLPYLERKAKLLGVEKLAWHDLEAPLGNVSLEYTYDEAAAFIIKHFHNFSPKLADFAKHALENRWIEAEDRKGKAPGGFCTEFPLQGETRIFMTFANTFTNVSTLAHELGHSFHSKICAELPEMAQHYRMNVAETASTMAEMIVIDAAIENAKNKEQRLALLDDKISRSIAFLMNIHARFLFEVSFYAERQSGYILPEKLSKLMIDAQKKAYLNALDEWHPYFWAAKLHFYLTEPFYNFPYTFGYLFSLGIYSSLKKDPKNAEEKYIALLKDTGVMNVEDLAQKHLNVDLQKQTFWEDAIKETLKDVDLFLNLS